MDLHGIRRHKIIEGGVKGPDFLGFVRRVLGPLLRPGKVVVMDNLRLHKNLAVLRFFLERRCRVVFIPPHSPDTNPIEMAVSKIKHLVRKAAARTLSGLRDAACDASLPRRSQRYQSRGVLVTYASSASFSFA
jgi:transposase